MSPLYIIFSLCSSIMAVQDLPFIQNIEKRFQSASLLLDSSLGHCFVDGLEHRDENAIYNCLRAYAAIDNTRNAEEIFRTTVVAPLIEKIIPHASSGLISVASEDELEADFREMKQCIEKDCTFLLRISSRGIWLMELLVLSNVYKFGLVWHKNFLAHTCYILYCFLIETDSSSLRNCEFFLSLRSTFIELLPSPHLLWVYFIDFLWRIDVFILFYILFTEDPNNSVGYYLDII